MLKKFESLVLVMLVLVSGIFAQPKFSSLISTNNSSEWGKKTSTSPIKKSLATLDSLIGENFPICEERGDQHLPAIAFNSTDNEYLIIWQDNRNDPNTTDIYGRRVALDGNPLGNEFAICTASNWQCYPAVAYNSRDNEYLALWVDYRNQVQDHPHDIYIYGQRIANNGTLINNEFPISTMLTDIIRNPAVAYSDSLNEYLVVWEVDIDTSGPPGGWVFKIRGQQVSSTGELLDNPNTTADDESDSAVNFSISVEEEAEHQGIDPDIVYNPINAEFMVVWRDGREVYGSGNDDIFGQILSSNGKHMLNHDIPICLQHDRDGNRGQRQNSPSVAYNERENEYFVAWYDERNDSNRSDNIYVTDIYGQIISDDGKLVDNPDTPENESDSTVNYLICTAEGIQLCPDIAYDKAKGIYVVIWSDGRNDPGDRSDFNIYGQCLSSKGELLDDLSTPENESYQMINFLISNGKFNQGTSDHNWWAEEHYGVSIPKTIRNSLYLVVWADQRNKDVTGCDIYGQRAKIVTSIKTGENQPIIPDQFLLYQNYPNPFNSETIIRYQLPKSCQVKLVIYNLAGQRVTTLVDEQQPTGCYSVQWNGRDHSGKNMASGIYLYQLETNESVASKKMFLLR